MCEHVCNNLDLMSHSQGFTGHFGVLKNHSSRNRWPWWCSLGDRLETGVFKVFRRVNLFVAGATHFFKKSFLVA